MVVFKSGVESRGARALVALAFMVAFLIVSAGVADRAYAGVIFSESPELGVTSDFNVISKYASKRSVTDISALPKALKYTPPERSVSFERLASTPEDGGTPTGGTFQCVCLDMRSMSLPTDASPLVLEASDPSNPLWRVDYKTAVYDRDGRVYDAVVDCTRIEVAPHTGNNNSNVYYYKSGSYGLGLFNVTGADFSSRGFAPITQDVSGINFEGGTPDYLYIHSCQVGVALDMSVTFYDSYELWKGGATRDDLGAITPPSTYVKVYRFDDLDQPDKRAGYTFDGDYAESVEVRAGSNGNAYVRNDCCLNIRSVNWYRATRATEPSGNGRYGIPSSVWIEATQGGHLEFTWRGSSCGTGLGMSYEPMQYPDYYVAKMPSMTTLNYDETVVTNQPSDFYALADHPQPEFENITLEEMVDYIREIIDEEVEQKAALNNALLKRTKEIAASGSADGKRRAVFIFRIDLPWTDTYSNANIPESMEFTDTFDDCFDPSTIEVTDLFLWRRAYVDFDGADSFSDTINSTPYRVYNYAPGGAKSAEKIFDSASANLKVYPSAGSEDYPRGWNFEYTPSTSTLRIWNSAKNLTARNASGTLYVAVRADLKDQYDFNPYKSFGYNNSLYAFDKDGYVCTTNTLNGAVEADNAGDTIHVDGSDSGHSTVYTKSSTVDVKIETAKLVVGKDSPIYDYVSDKLYNVEKAQFGLYPTKECHLSERVALFHNGETLSPHVLGTYWLKEEAAPESGDFEVAPNPRKVTFTKDDTVAEGEDDYVTIAYRDTEKKHNRNLYTVTEGDEPYNAAYPDILFWKVDADGLVPVGQGNAGNPEPVEAPTHDFSEVRFQIDYYAGSEITGTPTVTSVWGVDADGAVRIKEGKPVSVGGVEGVEWPFRQASAKNRQVTDTDDEKKDTREKVYNCLPYGTYVVKEVKAPTGYNINEEEYIFQVYQDRDGSAVVNYTSPNWTNKFGTTWVDSLHW